MERSKLKIRRNDSKRNSRVIERTQLEDVDRMVMRKKWTGAGHIARKRDE